MVTILAVECLSALRQGTRRADSIMEKPTTASGDEAGGRPSESLPPESGKGIRETGSWAAPAFVGLAAILVFVNALPNGFAYDDMAVIAENPRVHDLSQSIRIWLTPYWHGADGRAMGLYRPLTIFLFGVQWAVGGGGPLLFHLLSVVLHAFASVLVFFLIEHFVGRRGAMGGALLFAVHPVHVEAVANVVGQAELVSALFVLGASVVWVRRPGHGELPAHLRRGIAGAFLLGVLAKEGAIVLPLLLLALDLAAGRVTRPGYLRSVAKLVILLAGIVFVYLSLRFVILGGDLTGDVAFNLPFLQEARPRVLTALSVWPHYARLLFAPLQLSAMYDPGTILPPQSVTPSVVFGSALILGVLVAALCPRFWPALGLGAAWFFITILLVSNLVVPIGTVLAERTLYLPSVALALWVGFGVRRMARAGVDGGVIRPLLLSGYALILLAFGFRTVLRNPVWLDNETLFQVTLRDHPENFRAQWMYARLLWDKGDPLESRPYWEKALDSHHGHTGFLVDYGRFLLESGEIGKAEALVDEALELRPQSPSGLFTRGLISLELNNQPRALEQGRILTELGFPDLAEMLRDSVEKAFSQTTR